MIDLVWFDLFIEGEQQLLDPLKLRIQENNICIVYLSWASKQSKPICNVTYGDQSGCLNVLLRPPN